MNKLTFKPIVFKTPLFPTNRQEGSRFGQVSYEILYDFLTNLNQQNIDNLNDTSTIRGNLKNEKVVEHVLLICEELELEAFVGFHGIEILERFLVKHIESVFLSREYKLCDGAASEVTDMFEELVFQSLKEQFYSFIFLSVQIASKLFCSNMINISSASKYIQSLGSTCSKDRLIEMELYILKTLDFKVNVPNPLLYVETLLEVLSYNDPSVLVAQLNQLCRYILQFIFLQRKTIYNSLFASITGCMSPSHDERDKFLSVTEDYMLLGVGVIAVAAFIYQPSWERVLKKLTLITGISAKSIVDFAYVTLIHIMKDIV